MITSKKHVYFSAVLLTAALLFGSANAGLVLQPSELNPGDQYRLVFTTSTGRNAVSSSIGDYNSFVQGAADGSDLSALGQTWTTIAATTFVHAHDNTQATFRLINSSRVRRVINQERN